MAPVRVNDEVVTRFAPSPTGHLHVGGARTALFNWAYARRHSGRFLLRIEDTDSARSSEAAARGIMEDLAWLGIRWDDGPAFTHEDGTRVGGNERGAGPFLQSLRLSIYNQFFHQLIERDLAYPAFDSPDELAQARAQAREEQRTFRYTRAADYDRAAALDRMRREPHVLRFRMTERTVTLADELLGQIEFTEEHFDDFVIRKPDGMPTYHFAVVVDDELMGITHVIRGQEHLNNTPRHIGLQRALQRTDATPFRVPRYCHIPLIFNPDGSKMSKRDKDKAARTAALDRAVTAAPVDMIDPSKYRQWLDDARRQLEPPELAALSRALGVDLPEIDVSDFRASGYLPEVMVNYLALLGWNPKGAASDTAADERFDAAFLTRRFGFDGLGKSASRFDRQKLLAFNADAIQGMPPSEFASRWRRWLDRYDPHLRSFLERPLADGPTGAQRFELACTAVQPRARTYDDARDPIAYALVADDTVRFDPKAVEKVLTKGDPPGLDLLREFRDQLERVDPFEPDAIEAAAAGFCESRTIKLGRIAQPLRVAVTGGTASPPLGPTLAILGRASTIARIDRCLERCVQECQP